MKNKKITLKTTLDEDGQVVEEIKFNDKIKQNKLSKLVDVLALKTESLLLTVTDNDITKEEFLKALNNSYDHFIKEHKND